LLIVFNEALFIATLATKIYAFCSNKEVLIKEDALSNRLALFLKTALPIFLDAIKAIAKLLFCFMFCFANKIKFLV
jgi:hypothetical protein